jgi:hypothetical protein
VKINPTTTVSPAYVSNMVGANASSSDKPKAAHPVAHDSVVVTLTSVSPLSDETKKNLTFTAQEFASHSEHTHKIPPAQQARAALVADPSLAALPFGAIVSAIARGEPLPIAAPLLEPAVEPAPDPVEEELPTQPVDAPLPEDVGPTTVDLTPTEPASGLATDPVIDQLLGSLET